MVLPVIVYILMVFPEVKPQKLALIYTIQGVLVELHLMLVKVVEMVL
jgi:hypothetical protein